MKLTTNVICLAVVALAITLALLDGAVEAKDPATSWLGYAKATSPDDTGIITYVEAKWVVLDEPKVSGAYVTPWFGIESSENMNLIQPVNPWNQNFWEIYNEYFQWFPVHNTNSNAHKVQPGDVIFGSVTYNPADHSYTCYISDLNDGWSVSTNFPVQKTFEGEYKNYTIVYVVFEHPANCDQFPPNDQVTFYDIKIEYDNVQVEPEWTTGYVADVCNNRAQIVNSTTVQITWNSQ
eukprot:TRINITY_DN11478_c0_g1_i1.p1 TRINITY_DN11478_c0_g1~~TRINITY_DN11478_c0_g1_i1.p1  ORF type:complete len:252 (+),score=67.06 TRINITY_DN11478_c0_g1_i1:50-757(+)